MARSFAAVYTRIWADPEWRDLGVDAQHLYLLLLSQDNLNLAGVIPYQLRRWSNCAAGWDTDTVAKALDQLAQQRFVLVDEDTEEVLIRTMIRNDGAYRAPGSLKAILTLAVGAQSSAIRSELAVELGKLDPLEGKTAEAGMAAIASARATLSPGPDPTPDGTRDGIPDGTPDGMGGGFLGSHPRWDVSDSTQPITDPTPDGTGSGSGSVPLLSLVEMKREGERSAPPAEAPRCSKHAHLDPWDTPKCRACQHHRERWEVQRDEWLEYERTRPREMCPEHVGQLAEHCGPCRSERIGREAS